MGDLYKTIQEMCKAKHISVTKMCEEADIHRNVMGNLRSGRTKIPSTETLYKLSKYFNVPPSFFLDLGEPDPADIPPLQPASRDQVLFALYKEVPEEITDAEMDEIQQYAEMVLLRKRAEKDEKGE